MADEIIPEEWRIVADFPDYEVSDQGRVRRTTDAYLTNPRTGLRHVRYATGRLLLTGLDSNGYPFVRLSNNGAIKNFKVSILTCSAFHGPRPTFHHEAAHNNGIKTDNRADNLRWATHAENEADKETHGTRLRGTRHPQAIFCEADIWDIRSRLADGQTIKRIASDYGCSFGIISHIKTGRGWGHVK